MLEGLYKRKKTSRFDVLFYIVAAIFIVLALRLLTLQILAGGYYQAKAEGNRTAHGYDDSCSWYYVRSKWSNLSRF